MGKMSSYPISFWWGVPKEFLCRERIVEAWEAGFNVIEASYDRETNFQVLRWCEELGIRANVGDERILAALSGADNWQELLDGVIADYKDFAALNRFYIKDEPLEDWFEALGRVARYINVKCPEHGEFINLYPMCALPRKEGESLIFRYERHLEEFCKVVAPTQISFDHYNLKFEEVASEAELGGRCVARLSCENVEKNGWQGKLFAEVDAPDYYNNLEMIRAKAQGINVPWQDIILVAEHWHYRLLTEAELRWEALTAFAYGADSVCYFCYWTPVTMDEGWSYHNAVIHADGKRSEKYDMIKAINCDIQKLYSAFGDNAASVAVWHVGEVDDELARPFINSDLVKIEAERLLVGEFNDNRFVLVNKNYKAAQNVKVSACTGRLVRFDRACDEWMDFDGNVEIAAGDCELIAVVDL